MSSLSLHMLLFIKLVFSLALKANIIYNVVYISSGWVLNFSLSIVFESIKKGVILNNNSIFL